MNLIANGIKEFVQDPVGETEKHIKAQLDEANRLEKQGKINEADQIRASIALEGMFAVMGVQGALKVITTVIKRSV